MQDEGEERLWRLAPLDRNMVGVFGRLCMVLMRYVVCNILGGVVLCLI